MPSRKAEAVQLLFELKKNIRPTMKRPIQDTGITMPQGMVIGILSHFGEMKVTELSGKLGFSNSTVSGILDRLEKQKIVERVRSTEDKRIVYVKLQPEFVCLHEKFHKEMEEYLEKMLDNVSEEEIEKIIEAFTILIRVFKTNDGV